MDEIEIIDKHASKYFRCLCILPTYADDEQIIGTLSLELVAANNAWEYFTPYEIAQAKLGTVEITISSVE